MSLVREAASFEGLIIVAVISFVLSLLSRSAKRQGQSAEIPAEPDEPTPTQEEGLSLEKILQEIERVKKEKAAERRAPAAQRPAPPPVRRPTLQPMRRAEPQPPKGRMASGRRVPPPSTEGGPLGRHGTRALESHEEVEERESHDRDSSREVEESLEVLDETRLRPARREQDQDDEAEGIVQRRVKAAESRNRAHTEQDHREFHDRVTKGEIGAPETEKAAARARSAAVNLRRAVVWREILGPPKGLED